MIKCNVLNCSLNIGGFAPCSELIYENPCFSSEPIYDSDNNIIDWLLILDDEE